MGWGETRGDKGQADDLLPLPPVPEPHHARANLLRLQAKFGKLRSLVKRLAEVPRDNAYQNDGMKT